MRSLLILLLFSAGASAATLSDTVAMLKRSIVAVGTLQANRAPPVNFLGTGFAVSDGTYVVTNAHVIPPLFNSAENEKLVVFSGRGNESEAFDAKKILVDPAHDLALLKIEGGTIPALHFGDSSAMREGDSLAFTGFPIGVVLGYYPVTHRATLSAITPIVIPALNASRLDAKSIKQLRTPFTIFQLDATAYPGNSGSPLFESESGKVVGIVNMVFVKSTKEHMLSDPSGIAYAIPGEYIVQLVRDAGLVP